MAERHDRSHVTRLGRVARLDRMGLTQSSLVRIGCILMIAAAGMRAVFTALFELDKFGLAQAWPMQWSVGYLVFIGAYALASRTRLDHHYSWRRQRNRCDLFRGTARRQSTTRCARLSSQ